MKRLLLRILFFPSDWLRFTFDIHRLAWRWTIYNLLHRYAEQPCFYCQGRDNGRSPRPLPPGIRRYRNRWLIQPWMPCLQRYPKYGTCCNGEGGYLHVRFRVVPVALFTAVTWLGLACYLFSLFGWRA